MGEERECDALYMRPAVPQYCCLCICPVPLVCGPTSLVVPVVTWREVLSESAHRSALVAVFRVSHPPARGCAVSRPLCTYGECGVPRRSFEVQCCPYATDIYLIFTLELRVTTSLETTTKCHTAHDTIRRKFQKRMWASLVPPTLRLVGASLPCRTMLLAMKAASA